MVTASELRELRAAEAGLEDVDAAEEPGSAPGSQDGAGFQARAKYLRLVRRLQLRRSALVARHGLALLNSPPSRRRLGDEVWDVLEQVAIAAMDINSLDAAKECIGALMLKFKKSARVGRLEGMWLEAKGWWEQAERVYDGLLQEYPMDRRLMKRHVASLRGQGKLLEASQALRKYLETEQADVDAWRELADLYLAQNMLRQAAFCQEELLLSHPTNPIYNLHYAEMLYSLGGLENLKAARTYYAAALEFSAGESVRALWGVCMVEAAMRQGSAKSSKAQPSELAVVAAASLSQMYKAKCGSKQALADAVVSQLINTGGQQKQGS